jgi:DNA-binding protein HU-beta
MNKSELIAEFAEETNSTKVAAEKALDFLFDKIQTAANEDGVVRYGKHIFKKKTRAARAGRNPRTGETIQIPEKSSVVYKFTG